jgi:hypothetical protein
MTNFDMKTPDGQPIDIDFIVNLTAKRLAPELLKLAELITEEENKQPPLQDEEFTWTQECHVLTMKFVSMGFLLGEIQGAQECIEQCGNYKEMRARLEKILMAKKFEAISLTESMPEFQGFNPTAKAQH